MPRPRSRTPAAPSSDRPLAARLRIIGGSLRGRTILYNGDPGLRPMKDRVREAVFNLLGPQVVDKVVVDLFAGTGAMAFEALSRGARHATLIERRFPNVRVIEETAATLEVAERMIILAGDAFRWTPRNLAHLPAPWLIFCCPPYEFFVTRRAEMLALIRWIWQQAPAPSVLVVESDERFDTSALPDPECWDVRHYPPAVVALARATCPSRRTPAAAAVSIAPATHGELAPSPADPNPVGPARPPDGDPSQYPTP